MELKCYEKICISKGWNFSSPEQKGKNKTESHTI